jgi:hypothetical protein
MLSRRSFLKSTLGAGHNQSTVPSVDQASNAGDGAAGVRSAASFLYENSLEFRNRKNDNSRRDAKRAK